MVKQVNNITIVSKMWKFPLETLTGGTEAEGGSSYSGARAIVTDKSTIVAP